ncbi:MAG: helix-turn-helix transcriptional regulator [Deltaproteobacteria bacterium]|nr:helix-turn-helix transcriptional regulator [Deltaproteobacteria bacterium]
MGEPVAEIVKYHRKQSKLTRRQLADLAGVGKTAVYDIEAGKESIRFSTLTKVLNALNIRLIYESPLMDRFHAES